MKNYRTARDHLIAAQFSVTEACKFLNTNDLPIAFTIWDTTNRLVSMVLVLEDMINEEEIMDKQIKKVEKDVKKGEKKKAKKDIKKLLKMDKKMDAKVAKCSKVMKKGPKKK